MAGSSSKFEKIEDCGAILILKHNNKKLGKNLKRPNRREQNWGLISSEKRDKFNIPIYAASQEELKEVVEREGSFIINKLQLFKGGSPLVVNHRDDAAEIGRALATTCRSVSGVLVDAHIGNQLGHELFSRVVSRASARAQELLDQLQFFHIVASLSLKLD